MLRGQRNTTQRNAFQLTNHGTIGRDAVQMLSRKIKK
jgi:hypothetical protein